MIASLILLVAATSMVTCANRLQTPGDIRRPKEKTRANLKLKSRVVSHSMSPPMMPTEPMVRTHVSFPDLNFQLNALADDDVPEEEWKANVSSPRLSSQASPPITIFGLDARRILAKRSDSFVDPFEEKPEGPFEDPFYGPFASLDSDHEMPPLPKLATKYWQDDKALVLHNMQEVIAQQTSIFTHLDAPANASRPSQFGSMPLEMVGLIPKDVEVRFLESGASAVDKSVLALGVFARGQVKDDSSGSLRRAIEEQYRKEGTQPWWGPSDKQFDVFAIEGLADAPGLPERSARVLASKMHKYAHEEKRIVVVPMWACTSSDGRDLAEYYVRLGFEMVEMEDGLEQYVYTGTSSSAEDVWVENQQIMVGLNLWVGF